MTNIVLKIAFKFVFLFVFAFIMLELSTKMMQGEDTIVFLIGFLVFFGGSIFVVDRTIKWVKIIIDKNNQKG